MLHKYLKYKHKYLDEVKHNGGSVVEVTGDMRGRSRWTRQTATTASTPPDGTSQELEVLRPYTVRCENKAFTNTLSDKEGSNTFDVVVSEQITVRRILFIICEILDVSPVLITLTLYYSSNSDGKRIEKIVNRTLWDHGKRHSIEPLIIQGYTLDKIEITYNFYYQHYFRHTNFSGTVFAMFIAPSSIIIITYLSNASTYYVGTNNIN